MSRRIPCVPPGFPRAERYSLAQREDRTDEEIEVHEEQLLAILRGQDAGAKTADVCHTHGISRATLYAWKAKFGGFRKSDARRLKALEAETVTLKRLYAEAMLYNAGLKDLLSSKW